MPLVESLPSVATHFIRKMRGGSQPILVQANDGHLYVAKFASNPQGANVPWNESMGAELYRACGLGVPAWKPLLFTNEFLHRNPGCWIETEQGLVQPQAGFCFGSRYLATKGTRVFEILPETAFERIQNRSDFWLAWLIDVCAEHADNRQAVFVETTCGRLSAHFIDHGHLFGGAQGNRRAHFVTSRYLDPRIYPRLSSEERLLGVHQALQAADYERLTRRASVLPEEWKRPSALKSLERCLHRLSDRSLIENLLDAMVESVARRIESERIAPRHEHRSPVAVLRAQIRAGTAGPNFAVCGVDSLARNRG